MTGTRSVVVEREFPFAPEKLWRALTTPHLIAEWLMKNDFQPEVGHHFQLRGDWGGVLDCEVLTLEPYRELSYTWIFQAMKTIVTFTLTPAGAGTHLRVEQAGFPKDNAQAFGGAMHGWRQFLGKLEDVLQKEGAA